MVSLIAVVIFIFSEQKEYLLNMDLGYSRENVIVHKDNALLKVRIMIFSGTYFRLTMFSLSQPVRPGGPVVPQRQVTLKEQEKNAAMNTYGVNMIS